MTGFCTSSILRHNIHLKNTAGHLHSEQHCHLTTYTVRHALPRCTCLFTRKAIRLQ